MNKKQFRSRVYTDRPPYADFDAPNKFMAIESMGRFGMGTELNVDYFRDGVGYMQAADAQAAAPTLFDLIGQEA